MPAGHNEKERFFKDIKIDKENDVCFFNDEQHKYYNKETVRFLHNHCKFVWTAIR